VIKRLEGTADRVLLDVPCSGLGVLRRNPDSKWKLSRERISELEKLQAEILDSYSRMLKPGGAMVYSTCSIARAENQDAVASFLKRQPQFLRQIHPPGDEEDTTRNANESQLLI